MNATGLQGSRVQESGFRVAGLRSLGLRGGGGGQSSQVITRSLYRESQSIGVWGLRIQGSGARLVIRAAKMQRPSTALNPLGPKP